MSNTLSLTLFYQADEEVLQSSCWYVDLSGDPAIDVEVHRELAEHVAGNVSNHWDLIMGNGVVAWAIEVNVPNQAGGDFGPFRYIENISYASINAAAPMPDSVIQRVRFEGTNALGQPVTGGIRLSGVPSDKIDCQVMTQQQLDDLSDFIDDVFPASITLAGGESFTRVVVHKRGTVDEEFVPAPNNSFPARATSRVDRVLNRTQGRASPTGA